MPPPLAILARLRAQQGTSLSLSHSLIVVDEYVSTIQVIDSCNWFFFFWSYMGFLEFMKGMIDFGDLGFGKNCNFMWRSIVFLTH